MIVERLASFVTELDDETRRLHEEQVVQSRMVTTFTDVVFYVLYLCLLVGISDEVGGARSFLQTDNVKHFLPVLSLITPLTINDDFFLTLGSN